ncbi:MAG: nitroreductase [Gammaproteobacteria bacterium]|nr:nitroreductase [Gammaproteobacteria bacterium]
MSNLLEALQQRRSFPARLLEEPAPTDDQINELLQCAITAPDHGALHPWRFVIIRGNARSKLGEVFAEVLTQDQPNASEEKIRSVRDKPLRSPLIIAVIASIDQHHPKTPPVEQLLSAGVAASQLQLAATAMGFGSIWLTGPNAYHPTVKQQLGVSPDDEIVGFIYIGTATVIPPAKKKQPVLSDHVSEWHGD